MKKLLIALTLGCSISAFAEDMRFGMNIGTYHFKGEGYNMSYPTTQSFAGEFYYTTYTDKNYQYTLNSWNPGIYVIKDGWSVGVYKNSIYRTSVHASYTFYNVANTNIDISTGIVGGYEHPITPMIFPSIKVGYLRVGFLLPVKGVTPGITFAVEQ